jgi:hypothetical protein
MESPEIGRIIDLGGLNAPHEEENMVAGRLRVDVCTGRDSGEI